MTPIPKQSPAIAAAERWNDVDVAGEAAGAIGTAGENVVVG